MLHCCLVETDEYKMASEQEWPIPTKHYTFKTCIKNQLQEGATLQISQKLQ